MNMPDTTYIANFEILGEQDMGVHQQVRYVQGDVAALQVRHGANWRRLPLGGIVAGPPAEMRIRNIFPHRPANVVLEFGLRDIAHAPQLDVHAVLKDELRVEMVWDDIPDAAGDVVRYLLAAPGYGLDIETQRMGDVIFEAMVLPSPLNRAALTIDDSGAFRKVSAGGASATAALHICSAADDMGADTVGIDLRYPWPIADRCLIKMTCPAGKRASERTLVKALIKGQGGA